MNFWMALDRPQVCLGLHMLPWTVHLQQISGGSVAQPNVTVPGLQQDKRTQSAQILICTGKQKTAPEESNYVNLLDVNIFC